MTEGYTNDMLSFVGRDKLQNSSGPFQKPTIRETTSKLCSTTTPKEKFASKADGASSPIQPDNHQPLSDDSSLSRSSSTAEPKPAPFEDIEVRQPEYKIKLSLHTVGAHNNGYRYLLLRGDFSTFSFRLREFVIANLRLAAHFKKSIQPCCTLYEWQVSFQDLGSECSITIHVELLANSEPCQDYSDNEEKTEQASFNVSMWRFSGNHSLAHKLCDSIVSEITRQPTKVSQATSLFSAVRTEEDGSLDFTVEVLLRQALCSDIKTQYEMLQGTIDCLASSRSLGLKLITQYQNNKESVIGVILDMFVASPVNSVKCLCMHVFHCMLMQHAKLFLSALRSNVVRLWDAIPLYDATMDIYESYHSLHIASQVAYEIARNAEACGRLVDCYDNYDLRVVAWHTILNDLEKQRSAVTDFATKTAMDFDIVLHRRCFDVHREARNMFQQNLI